MTKKLPFQIDLNDLLAQLETASDDSIELTDYENDVPFFLSKFKIETGRYMIPAKTLYRLYRIYSKQPIDNTSFTKHAVNFIKYHDRYFYINIPVQKIIKILNPQTSQNIVTSFALKKHFETFLEKANVRKGDTWIDSKVLHEVYRHYCIDSKIQKRMKLQDFVILMKLHFENRIVNRRTYFKLNKIVIDALPEETIQRIKNEEKAS